ncbi:MAG: hypothetical protein HYV90_04715 [Candidatus Woesebacteria bacterium]|nr:MAG: hypothetical protein HYV90_04715 [Candidatus Woesebacteria bacterium]
MEGGIDPEVLGEMIEKFYEPRHHNKRRPNVILPKGKGAEILRQNETDKAEQAIQKHISKNFDSIQDPQERKEKMGEYLGWVRESLVTMSRRPPYITKFEEENLEKTETENTVSVLHIPSKLSVTHTGEADQHHNDIEAQEDLYTRLENHINDWGNKVSKRFREKYGIIADLK